jgi:hypothetical protein
MLRIVDCGVGITGERMAELNELLREPPVVGLSVEPTLGMSVVSLLASRHGIAVTLSHGSPGTTVDVLLPSTMFGPIDVLGGTMPAGTTPQLADRPAPAAPSEQYEPDMTWAEEAVAAPDIDPMLPATPVMPAVPVAAAAAAATTFDHIVERDVSERVPSIPGEPMLERHVEPDLAPSWTNRSFDFSGLREESSVGSQPEAPVTEPAWYADETVDPTNEISVDERFDRFEGVPIGSASDPTPPSLPSRSFVTAEPVEPAPLPAPFAAPVVAAVAAAGEFDRVPAPPMTADGLSRRPVTPSDAMPPATVRLPDPIDPGLPTRTPGRGPEGPDRLAAPSGAAYVTDAPVAPTSSPSALQAALTAFDTRRNGHDSLPTRDRSEPALPGTFEEPASISQSRLDPEVLRERLRAFQTEFRTASAGGNDTTPDHSSNSDLGGDRR